jgi:hypothetical protein
MSEFIDKILREAISKENQNLDNTSLEGIEETEKPSAGLTKKQKSSIVKKAKKGEDIGKKGSNFDKVAKKAAEEYGSEESGEKVAAAAMWKNTHR